jgi:hypothetical protein
MAKGPNQHVVQKGEKWAVEPDGRAPTSTHRTQEAAIDAGRAAAKRNESELVIHGGDGKIREKNTYGTDPFPPKG